MDDYRYDGKRTVLYSEGDCVVTIIASEFYDNWAGSNFTTYGGVRVLLVANSNKTVTLL